jgi:serine protease Do
MRRTPTLRHGFRAILAVTLLAFAAHGRVWSEDRAALVRKDLQDFAATGQWIYNDLGRGFDEAKKSGKPLLVVLRCIPCQACRGFDEQVASFDERIRTLLDKFVRVRVPQTNGLDLSVFQFDYDVSFYAFFFHPDGTIYGRFGSRSTQEDKTGEVSIEAFREAMVAVLALHDRYPAVKDSLAAKKGPTPPYPVPEKFPSLEGRYTATLDYDGKVVQSCIHCHQIRDAERLTYRDAKKAIPEEVFFPYPSPSVLGLHLDPRTRSKISKVDRESPAAKAGLQDGDEIAAFSHQPVISSSDIEWVLHHAKDGQKLAVEIVRTDAANGKASTLPLELELPVGWRRKVDLSWRSTTWELRRMGTGGLLLEDVPDSERSALGITLDALALRAKHVGEYGEHATAKQAGFVKGDIIVAVDGQAKRMTESELIAYAILDRSPGSTLEFSVLRSKEHKTMKFRTK